MTRHPQPVVDEALRLLARGWCIQKVCDHLGIGTKAVARWAKSAGMTIQQGRKGGITAVVYAQHAEDEWIDAAGRLTESGRVIANVRRNEGWSNARIASWIGVHRSTIGREFARNSHLGRYNPHAAHVLAARRRARPKPRKLDDPVIRAAVIECLNDKLSPEQTSRVLQERFATRHDKRVSHETIYQALYVQGKGALRHELTVEKALRSGRKTRKPQSKLCARGAQSWIGDALISARPKDAEDRAVPGHWEGDLIIGTGGKSALITLVERHTRFVMIERLPLKHDSDTVTSHLIQMIQRFPAELRRSLTWDRGSEMRHHARFTVATNCAVFFCDPHSPWQRGTNENTNGLIRDFYPKSTDFRQVSDEDIQRVAFLLNTRPRKTLGWLRPGVMLNELLAVAPTT